MDIPRCPKCGGGCVHQTDMTFRGSGCRAVWKCDAKDCGHTWETDGEDVLNYRCE